MNGNNRFTRRTVAQAAMAAAPLAMMGSWRALAAPARPNSRVAGVQIGAISGSFSSLPADQLIPSMLKVGLSEMELLSTAAEALAGAPGSGGPPRAPQTVALNADGLQPRCANMQMIPPYRTTGGEALPAAPLPPERQIAQREAQERLWAWRRATTPETWRAVRRQFDAAGIELRVLWYGLGFFTGESPSDEEIDYAFRMAKGLGVKSLSGSALLSSAARINAAAVRHGLTWAGHTQDNIYNPEHLATPEVYDKLLGTGRNLRICLDVGYFTAAGFDAVAYLEKHYQSITDIHFKDRKRSKSLGGDVTSNLLNNWPFGQGDAPLREVLQLLKKRRWDIPVQIEFDYGCRTSDDAVTEVARCYKYCRDALEST